MDLRFGRFDHLNPAVRSHLVLQPFYRRVLSLVNVETITAMSYMDTIKVILDYSLS